MRVTQRTMYSSMVGQMNSTLADYMESNIQGGTMKKLNRPSDDPAGAARVISYRASLARIAQHEKNSNTAQGWLNMADATLNQTSNVISEIKALAQQAANGTYTAEQRAGIASELREKLGTLLNLSNTEFEGKHLFAGQDYHNNAYKIGVGLTIEGMTPDAPNPPLQVVGDLPRSAQIRFPAINGSEPPRAGTVPPTSDDPAVDPVPTAFEYSMDGGKTWNSGTIPVGQNSFSVGGATITVPQTDPANPNVFKPNAYVSDGKVSVANAMGTAAWNNNVTLSTDGMKTGTKIRFPEDVDLTAKDGTEVKFEYSTDGGTTWKSSSSRIETTTTQAFDATTTPPTPEQRKGALTLKFPEGGSVTLATTEPYTMTVNPAVGTNPATPGETADPGDITLNTVTGNKTNHHLDVTPENNGTQITVRPTAIYQGTDNNATPKIVNYGNASEPLPPQVISSVTGVFNQDVMVKFPDNKDGIDLTKDGKFTYSYSTDGGNTWVTAEGEVTHTVTQEFEAADPPTPGVAGTPERRMGTARILLPGGYMDLQAEYTMGTNAAGTAIDPDAATTPASVTIPKTSQLVVKPQRTDLSFEIMQDQYMTVNNVGKDIFGGLYNAQYNDDILVPAFGEHDGRNLFETVGRLIGACETNDTEGIGQSLEELDLAQKNLLTKLAAIGGKENRLQTTMGVLDTNKLDQTTRMSEIEDVDLTELMVKLSQQQMAYSTVLKSSSMIMQLNLMQYLR